MTRVLLFFLILNLLACRSENSENNISGTVGSRVNQTPIESQGAIGFCVSYSLVAFIESEHKRKTGKEINLSEEYLGFMIMMKTTELLLNRAKKAQLSNLDMFHQVGNGILGLVEGTNYYAGLAA